MRYPQRRLGAGAGVDALQGGHLCYQGAPQHRAVLARHSLWDRSAPFFLDTRCGTAARRSFSTLVVGPRRSLANPDACQPPKRRFAPLWGLGTLPVGLCNPISAAAINTPAAEPRCACQIRPWLIPRTATNTGQRTRPRPHPRVRAVLLWENLAATRNCKP